MLDFELLRAFVVVAECGGFHRAAELVVIGDRRVFDAGARIAGLDPDLPTVAPDANHEPEDDRPVFIDLRHLDPSDIRRGGERGRRPVRACQLPTRACLGARPQGGRRLLHAVQQEGDAARASGL
jgi:hypothetical protein